MNNLMVNNDIDEVNQHVQSVLIIDDDTELCEMLSLYLETAGYHVAIKHNGQEGLFEASANGHYDLILLDVMMPKMDGFEVLKKLRATLSTPVLMLTARGDEYDRILGLELGADDYLPKPFNHRELLARVKAIFRRQALDGVAGVSEQDIQVGDTVLSVSRQTVTVNGNDVALTSTEFSILRLLMLNVGQRLTKDEISQNVLGKPLQAFDRSVDMHVSNLRKKLSQYHPKEAIKTIRGIGYLLYVE